MTRGRNPWIFWVSLLVAMLLMVMPVAPVLQPLRPAWIALVLAYWIIETPEKVSMTLAFFLGLIEDLVVGSVMGENALRLVVITFILMQFRARIRFFPLSQQALIIAALLFNDRLISTALHAFWGVPNPPVLAWVTPLIGFALWPLIFMALDSLRLANWKR